MISRFRIANPAVIPVIYLSALLMASAAPRAQTPVFQDKPDGVIARLPGDRPDLPTYTSRDITLIEANAPAYLDSPDKGERYTWINHLIDLERERLKPEPDLRLFWYQFIQARAPALGESEIDAIALAWWSAMGNRAIALDAHDRLRDASFDEVRAHFQTLRTGSDPDAMHAARWLVAAEPLDGWKRLRLLPGIQEFSPLAHLLARDIAQELDRYKETESEWKVRSAVKSLLTGKFRVAEETGIEEHVIVHQCVDELLGKFSSKKAQERSAALATLEEWLKRAIHTDLQNYEAAANAHSRLHGKR